MEYLIEEEITTGIGPNIVVGILKVVGVRHVYGTEAYKQRPKPQRSGSIGNFFEILKTKKN
ncbi:hypothetical protein ACTXT7_004862 [Hymenolepis weldensis]